jgi:hypothetical protein
MLNKILLLILVLSLPACATARSSPALPKLDKAVLPSVKEYTKEQQNTAADEMKNHCPVVPTLCLFIMDYSKMRNVTRIARDKPL